MDQAKGLLKLRVIAYWDDDTIDKLNYFWTTSILILCAFTIGMKQYVGSPLQCWVPVEFKKFWEQYAEHYCFVENTYFVPMNESLPDSVHEREERELGYYQWVPIVLALQAFLFTLPRIFWSNLNTQGFNIPAIMDSSLEITKDGKDKKQRLKGAKKSKNDVEVISQYIDDTVKYRRTRAGKGQIPVNSRNGGVDEIDIDPPYNNLRDSRMRNPPPAAGSGTLFGYYATTIYMLVKILYITNVVGQFFMMNQYLAPEYEMWGFGILNDLVHGRLWHESGHFPRVTLCDFEVRKLGQLHKYTIQCVLILNMLNEKLYLFLWWWFLLVAILTCLNFLYWLAISFNPSSRRQFVARYLFMRQQIKSRSEVNDFVDRYLRPDGVLLLRLISCNAGELSCTSLIVQLWSLWNKPKDIVTHVPTPTTTPTSPENEGFLESPNSSLSGK